MELFLGLLMLGAWVYSIVIVVKKAKGTTIFERTVLIFGLVAFVLYLVGSLSN